MEQRREKSNWPAVLVGIFSLGTFLWAIKIAQYGFEKDWEFLADVQWPVEWTTLQWKHWLKLVELLAQGAVEASIIAFAVVYVTVVIQNNTVNHIVQNITQIWDKVVGTPQAPALDDNSRAWLATHTSDVLRAASNLGVTEERKQWLAEFEAQRKESERTIAKLEAQVADLAQKVRSQNLVLAGVRGIFEQLRVLNTKVEEVRSDVDAATPQT